MGRSLLSGAPSQQNRPMLFSTSSSNNTNNSINNNKRNHSTRNKMKQYFKNHPIFTTLFLIIGSIVTMLWISALSEPIYYLDIHYYNNYIPTTVMSAGATPMTTTTGGSSSSFNSNADTPTNTRALTNDALVFAEQNAKAMSEWRSKTQASCDEWLETAAFGLTWDQKEQLERESISRMTLPSLDTLESKRHVREPYQYCKNVFIDLGTNIGDSIGYFIDNALDICTKSYVEKFGTAQNILRNKDFPRPHLDVTDLNIHHKGFGGNPLYGMLQSNLQPKQEQQQQQQQQQQQSLNTSKMTIAATPETFCVYGMEGNPEFTERLTKLENFIMDMKPRPIQHLHIHTESVITKIDGPTKLYLDKTSVAENFWGSSILSSQQDAQKSARELGNGTVFSADVQGVTLTTLVKSTMLPYKPGASPAEKESGGGLLIIKMDVEGAEYQVLKEVANSGILCDYIAKGNRVVMIVEYHNMSITDPTERRREKEGADIAQKQLETCGVEFGKLHAFWH